MKPAKKMPAGALAQEKKLPVKKDAHLKLRANVASKTAAAATTSSKTSVSAGTSATVAKTTVNCIKSASNGNKRLACATIFPEAKKTRIAEPAQMKVSRLIPFMAQCFFIFLHNRERIRLNKKVQKTGDDLYSGIEACLALTKEQTKFLFKTRRITNIFRRLDETSIAFTRLMAEYVDDFRGNPKNRGVDDNRIMGYAVFTMAIWRVFGTPMFARECGLLTTWNWQQKKRIKAIVEKYRDMDELPRILTMAYKPGSLILHRLQSKPPEWREIDIVFDTRMDDLWCIVFDLVRCAQKTHSWKVVCDFACQVRHLGDGSFRKRGPGFQCKELVQDLLDMRFFGGRKAVVDINTWCAVGPGAKRGAVIRAGIHKR
eukprot:GEMP01023663.1.p1 GENE.GEMP01023663.1~~GEMP01023663.1.p1  ORF type:complete len:372 (+),score=65.95 GEMP01023663.1:77-1192(+)